MKTATRIMCVVDSSDSSEDALRYAISKTKQQQAKLTVARIIPADEDMAEDIGAPAETSSSWWSPLDEGGVEIACHELHPHGNPAADIVGAARELSVDHIVMGTSVRRRSNHLEIDETARRVLEDAPCAVTVVNNEDVPQ